MKKNFHITNSKGFSIKFPNGYRVSVQFGPQNYCENRAKSISQEDAGRMGSNTAEVAVIDKYGKFIVFPGAASGDVVGGNLTPLEVVDVLNWTSKLTKKK
jgi:hypothetical protein